MPKRHTWNRHTIIAAVRERGSTLAGVGRAAGLSRATMSWALVKPHPRANRALAEYLGRSLNELWPQWFDRAGNVHPSPFYTPRAESAQTRPQESKTEAA